MGVGEEGIGLVCSTSSKEARAVGVDGAWSPGGIRRHSMEGWIGVHYKGTCRPLL